MDIIKILFTQQRDEGGEELNALQPMAAQLSKLKEEEKVDKKESGKETSSPFDCLPSFICSFFLIQFRGKVTLKG
jgi:hypothetical protein